MYVWTHTLIQSTIFIIYFLLLIYVLWYSLLPHFFSKLYTSNCNFFSKQLFTCCSLFTFLKTLLCLAFQFNLHFISILLLCNNLYFVLHFNSIYISSTLYFLATIKLFCISIWFTFKALYLQVFWSNFITILFPLIEFDYMFQKAYIL